MPLEGFYRFSGMQVPEDAGFVRGAGNGPFPVRGDGNGIDRVSMPLEGLYRLTAMQIPEDAGIVSGAGNGLFPVRSD